MKRQINAFTLAEVLITLGIIGVVAALTLPTLIKKYEAKALETQFEKAYSVLSQSNRMMLAQGTFPYEEFVLCANTAEEPDVSDPPSGGDSGDIKPPDAGDGGGSTDEGDEDNSGGGSMPDMNDETTQQLVGQILDNILGAILGDKDAQQAVQDAYNALVDKYGYNNVGEFLKDLIFGEGSSGSDDKGSSSDSSEDSGDGWFNHEGGSSGRLGNGLSWGKLKNNPKKGFNNITYKRIFAAVTGSQDASSNFVTRKKRQLEALKKNLSGAQYCKSYNECGSSPITYYNLTGTEEASIEAADFENSALILSNGSIIWLGDETNPQRYFVDVNGVKGPNRLGVDVFTFNLSKKNTIDTERTGDCTISNSPASGESYRGLGCSGYAAVNENPDDKAKPYWSSVR